MTKVLRKITLVAAMVSLGSAILSLAWIGHMASDDRAYINTALAWFNNFPVIPGSHWACRHTLTLPLGLGFDVFGFGEVQSVLPTLVFSIGILALLYRALELRWDSKTAIVGAAFLILTPLFAESATIAGVDPVEAFFVIASIVVFTGSAERHGNLVWLLLAGVCAGLAFISRETAGALVIFYIVSFIFSPLIERWRYFILGAGFLLVVGAEMVYFALVAGEPLLRFSLALGTVDLVQPEDPGTGNLVNDRWLGPLGALMLNNEFGWLFWLFIPAAWSVCIRPFGTSQQRIFLRTLLGLAIVWFLVVGYMLDLRPLPRYFTVTMAGAVIITGVWVWQVVLVWHRWAAYSIISFVFISNIILIDISNQQPLIAEREAVRLLVEDGVDTVYTDPRTAWRAEQLADWAGVSRERIAHMNPPPDSLFLYSKNSVDKGTAGPYGTFDPGIYRPNKRWIEITRTQGVPTLVGRAIKKMGIDILLIRVGLHRIIWESPPVLIYRT